MSKNEVKWYLVWDAIAALLVWIVFNLFINWDAGFCIMPFSKVQCVFFLFVALAFNYLSGAYITTASRLRIIELAQTFVSTLLTSIVIFFVLLASSDSDDYEFTHKSFLALWAIHFTVSYVIRMIQTWKKYGRVSFKNINFTDYHDPLIVPMDAWQQAVKRVFDIFTSIIALVILSPLLLYIVIKIRMDSDGPVFFKQERIGMHGKSFWVYKFRSMYDGAEKDGPKLTEENDKRITPFGQIMRKYRLDELPQLWNVLKGDMSIVGPRPEREFFIEQIEKIEPKYQELYRIRPGLMSWGPIKVGYCDNIDMMIERLHFDLEYLNHMSLHTDIKIILLSVNVILLGKGR